MLSWTRPTNISELRGFLGLTGYYRKFVRNYGILACPLTSLLRKGQFCWNDDAEAAFEALKTAMTSTPTLAMPNFAEVFVIESDASGDGIGAVLTQQGRPIAFMSRALGLSKHAWSTYAREMLAIVVVVQLWRPYLLGRKFVIQTDQRSLKYLLEQRITTPEQQKWVSKLLGYDYEIVYKLGKENSAADALSRMTGSPCLSHLSIPQIHVWDQLKAEAVFHPYMKKIGKLATENPDSPYTWRNGLLHYKNRVVIAPNSDIIQQLLREFHDSPLGGHSGVLRTYKRLAQQFYWPSMARIVKEYVAYCDVCQWVKSDTLSPAGLLQPLPIPCQVWDDITMDFIEGLPQSGGKNTIFVVVDRLSKSAHFLALAHPYTAKMVAEKFVEGVVKLYGMTPFQALYGRLPPTIPHYHIGISPVNEVDQQLASRDEFLSLLKANLHAASNPMQQLANSKRRNVEFQVGDWVFLKLHPYRQQSMVKRVCKKLASRYYGPYQIEELIGTVAYRLKLPTQARIHPVFHVSLLKKKIGDEVVNTIDLPPMTAAGEMLIKPKAILDTRWIKKGSRFVEEILVKWKHLQTDDATWEDVMALQERFINLNLEDKVPLNGGGIDKQQLEPSDELEPSDLEPRRSHRVPKKNRRFIEP
jgi:hypothetical protein